MAVEHQKRITKLLGYDFVVEYQSGVENKVVDVLSCKLEEVFLAALSIPQVNIVGELDQQVHNDKSLCKLMFDLERDQDSHPRYTLVQGRLMFKGRLVVPKGASIITTLFKEYHDGPVGGYSRVLKTYKRLKSDFYWAGMKNKIEQYVAACTTCQQHKHSTLFPTGLLQPLQVPSLIWDDLTMDFTEGLPKSEGFDTILVIVDQLSKYAYFIALKHPFSAQSVALIFTKEVVRLHGVPHSIVLDRDKVFMSLFWIELFHLQGTLLKRSSTYHPQTAGQTGVVNRSIESYLRCFASDKPRQWARWLSWSEYWYNTSYHSSICTTPFRALYGQDPPPLICHQGYTTPVCEVDQLLTKRDAILDELKSHLMRARSQMKAIADAHRRNVQFQEGDLVYLKIQPYCQRSLAHYKNEKLAPRCYGPYEQSSCFLCIPISESSGCHSLSTTLAFTTVC